MNIHPQQVFLAIKCNDLNLIKKAIPAQHSAELTLHDETILMNAISNNRLQIAEYLLKMGANPNRYDYINRFALLHACSEEAVDLLIKYGADLEQKNNKNMTALEYHFYNPMFAALFPVFVKKGANHKNIDWSRCVSYYKKQYEELMAPIYEKEKLEQNLKENTSTNKNLSISSIKNKKI